MPEAPGRPYGTLMLKELIQRTQGSEFGVASVHFSPSLGDPSTQSASRTPDLLAAGVQDREFGVSTFAKSWELRGTDPGARACPSKHFLLLGSFMSQLGEGNRTEQFPRDR